MNEKENFDLSEDQLDQVSGGATGMIGNCPECGSQILEIDESNLPYSCECMLCGYKPKTH